MPESPSVRKEGHGPLPACLRGGLPRMLEGASLPMGVLESLVGRSTTFALDSGDWVTAP